MSKAIAEDLVMSYCKKFPIAIVRPSIIVTSCNEPEPGFIQGFQVKLKNSQLFLDFKLLLLIQSTGGLIAAAMAGLMHFAYQRRNIKGEFIPIDFAVNTTIAAAFEAATAKKPEVFFTSSCKSLTSAESRNFFNEFIGQLPPHRMVLWYPNYFIIPNFLIFTLLSMVTQILPAIFLDGLIIACGRKAL
jgi:alcohol-forming fatty acyl-CoA reductase